MELDIGTIVTLIITAIATFAGSAWAFVKSKLSKVVKLGTEAMDVITILEASLEDDKVTKEEIDAIKKEIGEVKVAWKALTKKD